jgi:thymidylate synthase
MSEQLVFEDFTIAYLNLLNIVFNNPDYICSPRDQKIKEKINVSFTILNPRSRLPFVKDRDISISYIIAEGLWYLAGLNSTKWISYYSKFWKNISDDGLTANSAYGSRIFKPNFRLGGDNNWNQWDACLDELIKDPDSRRAIIHIKSPLDSKFDSKDIPCTLTLQFLLRNDQLHLIVNMRSSDLWFGIANDVPAFTLFQELMALQLSKRLNKEIDLGHYYHNSGSLHIYERNFDKIKDIVNNKHNFFYSALADEVRCLVGEKFITNKYPIGLMPKMKSLPPIKEMLKFEKTLKKLTHPNQIIPAVDYLNNNPSYWNDWLIILASHRCGKLGYKNEQKFILNKVSWHGYKYFNR